LSTGKLASGTLDKIKEEAVGEFWRNPRLLKEESIIKRLKQKALEELHHNRSVRSKLEPVIVDF
jgi:hypothetical protein